MKKRLIYIIISTIFVFATGFIILKSKTHSKHIQPVFSELLLRNAALSQAADWEPVKSESDALTKK